MANFNNFEKKDTWSTKPFIAYDGGVRNPDGTVEPPAEVIVTKGVGKVKDIEEYDSRASISLKIEGLKYGINGYINTDDPAYEFVKKAYDNGELVQFRHEISRKKGIDRSKTMHELRFNPETGKNDADMAKQNTRKLFVGFGYPDSDLILSNQHLTNPDDDNKNKHKEGQVLSADSNDAVLNNASNDATAFTPSDNTGEIESKPWIGLNYDGTVNPGSYAVSCMPKMYFTLKKQLKDADIDDSIIRKTTEELVGYADRIQVQVYGGKDGKLKTANRFYNSHLVARSVLLELIESEGVDADIINDDNARHEWEVKLTREAYNIWTWAINNYSDFISSHAND